MTMSALRWNAVLMILAALVGLDAILIVTRDMKYQYDRETFMRDVGMMPNRRPSPTKPLPTVRKESSDRLQEEQDHRPERKPVKQEKVLKESPTDDGVHKVAGLNCDAYGGPSEDDAAEMVYWRDIPSDASFISPLKAEGPKTKYLTFEPDEGGWNNIRMSMETAVTLALAMGRTLVMPPSQGMYLLHHDDKKQKNRFTFSDFFHFDSVAAEHAGLEVISMKEFLEREAMTGNLIDKSTGRPTFPPNNNRTDWDGAQRHEAKYLDQWFRTFSTNPLWPFDQCLVGLPAKPGPEGPNRLAQIATEVSKTRFEVRRAKYTANPVPVNGEPEDRFAETFAHRNEICIYDQKFQDAKVLHMMGDNASGSRLLVHFYAYLFFEDWKQDLWNKRFVRDHLRYVDEIQCAAARVVKAMREKARQHGSQNGQFDTFHIRRGDFQYKDTRVEAPVIYDNIKDLVPEGTTIYIATDEKDRSFFQIFRQHYNVYFLDDFKEQLHSVNTNFYGMLDQRIASRGRTFIGCFYSTFTGYINRMRGYHSQKDKADGWEQGIINSWYYIPLHTKDALREYRPIAPAMWAREFPIGWRDLDKGIEEIAFRSSA